MNPVRPERSNGRTDKSGTPCTTAATLSRIAARPIKPEATPRASRRTKTGSALRAQAWRERTDEMVGRWRFAACSARQRNLLGARHRRAQRRQLHEMAEEQRKRSPTLTVAQCFARVFEDRQQGTCSEGASQADRCNVASDAEVIVSFAMRTLGRLRQLHRVEGLRRFILFITPAARPVGGGAFQETTPTSRSRGAPPRRPATFLA